MTWLVTGGAGYIGSHVVRRLRVRGTPVVVLDDLSTGDARRLPRDVPLVHGSIVDGSVVAEALERYQVSGVLHFAARKSVPESMEQPLWYYRENLGGMGKLLEAAVEARVPRVVFSSSAAVYGAPPEPVVTEESPTEPLSPYGETKLYAEKLLAAVGRAHGLSWIALRYFNVVGADDASLADRAAENLVPLIFRAIDAGRPIPVTGTDFSTRDGSGVRDYIHVADLADAHIAAVERVEHSAAARIYNVGTGNGYSVFEVLAAVRAVTGAPVEYVAAPRRPGDAAEVVASPQRIAGELGWSAKRGLTDMIRDSWMAWRSIHDGV